MGLHGLLQGLLYIFIYIGRVTFIDSKFTNKSIIKLIYENTSQSYGLPRPVTGIALLFCIVFIACNVSFIVCVALCTVSFERGVLFSVMCVLSYCNTSAIR
jgi:hypothetical protein